MARILSESFEGTGYENSWTETVDSGCICDEDASIPGTPPVGSGSQCLRITTNAINENSFAVCVLSNQNISYVRTFFRIANLSDSYFPDAITLLTSGGTNVASIRVRNIGGAYSLLFGYSNGGALTYTGSVSINTTTWYRVEFRYDITNMLWEWRINGATQHSGSLSGSLTPQRIRVGTPSTNNGIVDIHYDLVAWDDSNWIGAEPTPVVLTENLPLADFIAKHIGITRDDSISLLDSLSKQINIIRGESISLSDAITVSRLFYQTLQENISLSDAISFFQSVKGIDDSLAISDLISAYGYKQNKPLQSYKTTMLVDFAFTSGTKRFATDDIMITE